MSTVPFNIPLKLHQTVPFIAFLHDPEKVNSFNLTKTKLNSIIFTVIFFFVNDKTGNEKKACCKSIVFIVVLTANDGI